MRCEELASERDIGDVAPIGMDPLIEDDGRAAEGEPLSRAGG
jgi:hypothetical protein